MLGLTLRDEFKGRRLKGTAIELSNKSNTGATQISAKEFLEITYPTHDLLHGVEAIGPNQGRPVVVIGERGLGKSHLMAVLHHTVSDSSETRIWLDFWASALNQPSIGEIQLRTGMQVIGHSLHSQRYRFLWDVLFDNHPHGEFIKGKWDGKGKEKTDIPSDELILELLHHTPTMLLLDEFQTWYEGLTNSKQYPWRNWAFNFIQILSEIAREHPELLVLVVSIRNGDTEAYQQIHRVNPIQIDFKAGGDPVRSQNDRRRMLLHRLFTNRMQIAPNLIKSLLDVHVTEYFRLSNTPPAEQDRKRKEFIESWPYAPHLLRLLEDQVLVATDAQETRDLIRILANLFKSCGDDATLITAADFQLDKDTSGIGALLDSVANQQHRTLREKARRNVTAVIDAVLDYKQKVSHLQEIMGALWLRSIAIGKFAGAEAAELQIDITKSNPIDDNEFHAQLVTITDHSFNIHKDGSRFVFKEDENPQAMVNALAQNDQLFRDGSDLKQLAKEIRYTIGGSEDISRKFRVIALPRHWSNKPWESLEEREHPRNWDERLPILVLPERPANLKESLGVWLKEHVPQRRNTVRFLLPQSETQNVFTDRDLLFLVRAEMKAGEWGGDNIEYRQLQAKYQKELRDILKMRFDNFAILHRWDFSTPSGCDFQIHRLSDQGSEIPESIERVLISNLFVPEDFEDFVIQAASDNVSLGKLLIDLQEPRPAGQDCIPWLGEIEIKERILRMCAKGKIALNIRGKEYLQIQAGESQEIAWIRIRSKLPYTGRQLNEISLLPTSAVPSVGGFASRVDEANELVESSILGGGGTEATALPHSRAVESHLSSTIQQPADVNLIGRGVVNSTTPFASSATSPLILIDKLEKWGINPTTQVFNIALNLSVANGSQLVKLIKNLPEGMVFEISLEREDG